MSTIDNINGIYARDSELRSGISTLRNTVLSSTIKPLTINKEGTYTADPNTGTYGYSPVTVEFPEWEPLQDGYTNFWFELDEDTLSPWLNFSAKTANAVIDWGDGSGEQSLDTLTPTHTYSKAGRYIVKIKGVTGIAQQNSNTNYNPTYTNVITYVELNDEITALDTYAFWRCFWLRKISGTPNLTTIGANAVSYIHSLREFEPVLNVSSLPANFYGCMSLSKITFGSNLRSIANNSFVSAYALSELHFQSTTPPTLGATIFTSLPSNYVIYVPVGYGETYKTAWPDYASHIVEEGSQLSAQQLRKIAEETNNGEEMR